MSRKPGARGPLTDPVHVKLTPAQSEALEAAAVIHGCSAPELLRVALDELLVRERGEVGRVLRTIRQVRGSAERRRGSTNSACDD